MDKKDSRRSRLTSLSHALEILTSFTHEQPEWGVTELAEYLGMNKSTVHRLLVTLEVQGAIEKRSRHRYTLGLRIFEMGNLFRIRSDVAKMARPYMERLARELRLTVRLGKLEDGRIYDIARVDSPEPLWIHVGPRGREANCSAVGKLFLAEFSDPELEAFVSRYGLPKRTACSITDLAMLKKELNQVREQDYAIGNGEYVEWLISVAAPIRDDSGTVVCAMNVSGAVQQLPAESITGMARKIRESAGRISRQLGYSSHRQDL